MIPLEAPPKLPAPRTTPLVRQGSLWIKAEREQWTGSVKYRLVFAKVARALRIGAIGAGSTLIEATSGSTGVALAFAGETLGLPVEIHAPASLAPEKRARMEQSGARLVLYPPGVSVPEILERVATRVRDQGLWHLDQHDRRSSGDSYRELGEELLSQLRALGAPPLLHFLCPVGTGGLIQGLGGILRRAIPGIRVVALEPEAGVRIDGLRNTKLFHLGERDPYDRTFPDQVIRVPAPPAGLATGGLQLGESARAAMQAARDREREWGPTFLVAPD